MKYPSIKLDSQGRPLKCPNCGNEELANKGNFCCICGVNSINICEDTYSFSDNDLPFPDEDDLQKACSMEGYLSLDGNARYCPYCGNETSYYQRKWLKSWDDVGEDDELPPLPF